MRGDDSRFLLLLQAAIKRCGGEDDRWDEWARLWVEGERRVPAALVSDLDGVAEGVMIGLGMSGHDLVDNVWASVTSVPPVPIDPLYFKARARSEVVRAAHSALRARSASGRARAEGVLDHAEHVLGLAVRAKPLKGSVRLLPKKER